MVLSTVFFAAGAAAQQNGAAGPPAQAGPSLWEKITEDDRDPSEHQRRERHRPTRIRDVHQP